MRGPHDAAHDGPGWLSASTLRTGLFLLFGSGALLMQLGYSFEDGDQLQYLLLGYRFIYQDFLPGDWFTWETSHYHYSFGWIVYGLHAAFGEEGFPSAVFAVHLATLVALCHGTLTLSRAFGLGLAAATGTIALAAFVRSTSIGDATINHGQLLASDMALPPLLLAWAAWLNGRQRTAGLWLGLSGFLHANFAILGPFVLFPLELLRSIRTGERRPLLEMVGAYTLLAAPTLVLVVQSFLTGDSAPEAIEIVLRERSPHHYDLAEMGVDDFWWPVVLVCCGLPSWMRADHVVRQGPRRWLLAALVAVLLFGLLGSLLAITPVIRLFVWRLSIPLVLILGAVACQGLADSVKRRDFGELVYYLAAFSVAATFTREDVSTAASWLTQSAFFVMPAAVPLVVAAAALTLDGGRYRPLSLIPAALAISWAILVARVPLSNTYHNGKPFAAKVQALSDASIQLTQPPSELYMWVRHNTPRDAKFLIPPGVLDFRLRARRPVYVDWKCVPMKGQEALQWRRRMLDVVGTHDLQSRGYDLRRDAKKLYRQRPLEELVALARDKGLQYIVAKNRRPNTALMGAERLVRTRRWRLYRVMSPGETRDYVRAIEESHRQKQRERKREQRRKRKQQLDPE